MLAGGYAVQRHPAAQKSAHDAGQAPHPVKRSHNAAVIQFFHAHALRIDGNVGQVGRNAKEIQRRAQFPAAGYSAQ